MSLINIKQLRNLPQADPGAIIIYDGVTNVWSNLSDFAILFPFGDTSARPVSAVNGMARYNTDTNYFEFYQGDTWVPLNFIDNITISSFGGGNSIAIGVSANREIQLRTITGTGVLDATTVGNVVQLSAPRAVIDTSSLGGVSLGLAVSAGGGNRNELRVRGLVGGGIIEISALTNAIVISAPILPAQNITVSSFGGGSQVAIGVSGNREIHFRTLIGGGIVEVSSNSSGEIIISANSIGGTGTKEMSVVINQNSHGFVTGNVIYYNPLISQWQLAIANSANTLGVAIAKVINANSFEAFFGGVLSGFTDLSAGHYYFVSDVSAGELVDVEPNTYSNPVLYAITSTIGMVLPYRPSEVTSGLSISVSSVGTGASIFRNIENDQIILKTISSSKGINVSVTTNSVFIGLEDNLYEKLKTEIYDKKILYAENFDNPVTNNWFLNGLAPIAADELNSGLIIRKFYVVSARGVGYLYRFPFFINDNLKMRLRFVVRSVNAPTAGQTGVFRLYYRRITYNSAIPSWNLYNTITLTFQNNNNFQIFESTYSLSSSPFVSNQLYQFELIREPALGTVPYDLNLLEYSVEILFN